MAGVGNQTFSRKDLLQENLSVYDRDVLGLTAEGRRLKYQQMSASPYTFYRGSAYHFFRDLLQEEFMREAGTKPTWVQGDLHMENFGVFHNAQGEIVYDVNDFDEAYLGSYLLDIARMAVSIVLVGEEKHVRADDIEEAVRAYLKAYYKELTRYAQGEKDPVTTRFTEDNTKPPISTLLKKTAKKRSRLTLLEEFAELDEDGWRLKRNEDLEEVAPEIREQIIEHWGHYIASIPAEQRMREGNYRLKDMAHKRNSGTGSLGLDRFYLMIEGEEAGTDAVDDIILEMKEARYSVLDSVLPDHDAFHERYPHPGLQVIASQRAMQHQPDPFLGIVSIGEKDYYIRERSPYKRKLKLDKIETHKHFLAALKVMGKATAKIHARADADIEAGLIDYHSEEAILAEIDADRDGWYARLTEFAVRYAGQVREDYRVFVELGEKGWEDTE
ncbi:DUF2252 domain-containing protein [Brevibacillus dissolubilis]|uniref:DUF2252 domain-containing protein n=1 Tax=Brevibacillus dissolubilis TaxID=1844116 RepID=UPI00159BE340|nr:DUF2252 family protein [Brevibacillus dissolubilis]